MKPIFSLQNKIIAITGATGYLGSAMCEHLHQSGAIVILLVRNIDKAQILCQSLGIDSNQIIPIDITDPTSIHQAFWLIIERFKRLDVLVNNAAFTKPKNFGNYTKNDWIENFEGSVIATDMLIQEATKYMKPKQFGRLINISSMYGMLSPDESIYPNEASINPLAYGIGKAGIIQYTKYAAMKLAKFNITVNTISYGPFPNPNNVIDETFLQALASKTFLKRIGQAKEVTSAVFFLALDESSYVTGQNIVVDGGWTSW